MIGIGIDAVEIQRVQDARQFDRVAEYILTADERVTMNASRDRAQFLASRFAIKEAVIKAFPEALNLQEVSVLGYGGKPTVRVQHAEADVYAIEVGLTHTLSLAIAVAHVSRKS